MLALPAGVVTFLFSDVESSTRLLQVLGEMEYARRQEIHRDLLRAAFAAHDGVEISTEGDSFFVAFGSAADAVEAALTAQVALSGVQWPDGHAIRVRMGVHTGPATPVAGNYTALAVNQAARISAAAHGGQVLVSEQTRALVDGELSHGVTLLDLGEHRLKDLERPHRLLQVCHPDLPQAFPPPRSLELVRHNLPVQTSTFVGREQELAEVTKLLATARLVSLLGPGGTGKTRLSYQVAAAAVRDFPGGVWVTELAPVEEGSTLPSAVLGSLGLREEPGRTATDTVVGFLQDRLALVVLDNCEQAVAAAAELTQALLSRCPGVRVLATSREALRLPGEAIYQVPGLSLPPADLPDYLEALAASDAVRLFMARAVDVRPGFALTQSNAADIAAICTRLDGLPLAIELAASRARSLSAGQINERLSSALDLLSKGARGAQARQATLRGAIDWSYRLLGDAERVLFRRLAVFTGGWQLDAAEQVCSGDGLDLGGVLDNLDALVDKSLVAISEDDQGQIRYRLLETIRAYAIERLTEAGEADAIADRHSAWCASLALCASQAPEGSLDEASWFDRLQADHPNLLAALGHLRRRHDPEALEIAAGLRRFWLDRGHGGIAHDQLHAALAAGSGPSTARATALGALGQVALNRGDYPEAQARFQEALTMSCDLGDHRNEGFCVGRLGYVAIRLGDYPEARARFEEALAIARDLGDRHDEGGCVGSLGYVAVILGDFPEARARYQEALVIARDLGDRRSEGRWVGHLGNVAGRQGDYPEARARYQEALVIARDLGDRQGEGNWVGSLGTVVLILGDYPEARACFAEALVIARDLGDRYLAGFWVGNLGLVATRQGDYPAAAACFDEALALARELQAQDLSVATIDAVAVLLGRVGRYDEAVEFVAWVDETRRRVGAVREKADQESADETIAVARDSLGHEALAHASKRGEDRSSEEAFDIAAQWLAKIMAEPLA